MINNFIKISNLLSSSSEIEFNLGTFSCMKKSSKSFKNNDLGFRKLINILYWSKLITGKDIKLSIISYMLLYLSQNNNCQFSLVVAFKWIIILQNFKCTFPKMLLLPEPQISQPYNNMGFTNLSERSS
jgi:hypothetical protein